MSFKANNIKLSNPSPKEMDKMPSVFLAIPNMGKIQTDLMLRVIQWVYGAKIILFPPQQISPVSAARNLCVEEFLKQGYDYLFFVDDDTVPPRDALLKMLALKKKFVTGVTCNLKECSDGMLRPAPMVFKYDNKQKKSDGYKSITKSSGIGRIDGAGLSCALIHKSVFKNMKQPYFTERFVAAKGKKTLGEDFMFCQKLDKMKIEMWCDYSIHCSHHKQVKIDFPNQYEVKRVNVAAE